MRYFTIEQREALQRQLQARADGLRAAIARHMRLPNHNEETDDEAVADLETAIDVDDLERMTRQLQAVGAALPRLLEPDFGLCEDCAGEIPFSRLVASPTATRCIGCQSRHEHEHRARGAARL